MSGSSDSQQSRLDAILAEYLAAVEKGAVPDGDELISQNPEFADELREFFADKQQIDQMADGAASMPDAEPSQKKSEKTPVDAMAPTLPPTPHQHRPFSEGSASSSTRPSSPKSAETGGRGGSDLSTTASPTETVRYFGDYELLEEIARGGMGVVYKARQVNLNRIVALKMILAGQLASDEEVRRFHTEAEAAAGLDHPGIVPIYEVGQHEGQHYYSMGFVHGESLAQLLAQRPLPANVAADLVKQIAEAVAYAHQRGVIHRDLKPGNILLATIPPFSKGGTGGFGGDGLNPTSPPLKKRGASFSDKRIYQPKVTDFGLAKKLEVDSSLTGTGQILGTPSYMAPEQIKGDVKAIGPATDVYALGAVLYCALTGRPPFQSATPMETMSQVLEDMPVSPRKLNPSIGKDLDTICMKCLQKSSIDRYSSASDLASDLSRYLNDEPIRARPIGLVERTRRWIWKHRKVASLLIVVVLITVAAIWAATTGLGQYRQAQRGQLSITSTGPPLRAELYHEGSNELATEPFTIPMNSPLSIRSGSYRLVVSSPNRIGHSLNVTIAKKRTHTVHVELTDSQDWPSFELENRSGYESVFTVLPFSSSSDFIVVDPQAGVKRQSAGGKEVWHWQPAQIGDERYKEFYTSHWQSWISMGDLGGNQVQFAGDLDQDQEPDLIIRGSYSPSFLVFSGAAGKILWTFPRFEPVPISEGSDVMWPAVAQCLNYSASGEIGEAVIADVNDDGISDIVALAYYQRVKTGDIDPDHGGVESQAYLLALSGTDGSELWRTTLDPSWYRGPYSFSGQGRRSSYGGDLTPEIKLLKWQGEHPVVAVVCGRAIVTMDLKTGSLNSDPIELQQPTLSYCFADCDGDENDDVIFAVPIESGGVQVAGYSLKNATRFLDRTVTSEIARKSLYDPRGLELDWPQVVDLNDDGKPEALIQNKSDFNFCGFELVDITSQDVMWESKTRVQPQNSGGSIPRSDYATVGPDIDHDGFREVFLGSSGDVSDTRKEETVFVSAVSGRTGEQLWTLQYDVGTDGNIQIGPLKWWQTGPDGFPLLLVSYRSDQFLEEQRGVLMLSASDGLITRSVDGAFDPTVDDLDHDGLLDLVWRVGASKAGIGPGMVHSSRGTMLDRWQATSAYFPMQSVYRPNLQDLDADGFPEMLSSQDYASAISSRDGAALWKSKWLDGPLYSWTDENFHCDNDEIPDALFVPYGMEERSWTAVAGSGGRVIWRTPERARIVEVVAVKSHGTATFVVTKSQSNKRHWVEVSALSNNHGETLWLRELDVREFNPPCQAKFVDINADGTTDIIVGIAQDAVKSKSEYALFAIDGSSGKSMWNQTLPSNSSTARRFWFDISEATDTEPSRIVCSIEDEIDQRDTALVLVLSADNGEILSQKTQLPFRYITEMHLVKRPGNHSSMALFGSGHTGQRPVVLVEFDGSSEEELNLPVERMAVTTQFRDIDNDGDDECLATMLDQSSGIAELYAVEIETNEIIWRWEIAGHRIKFLTPANEMDGPSRTIPVLVDGNVYGIDVRTGELDWRCDGPQNSSDWRRYIGQGGQINMHRDPQIYFRENEKPLVFFYMHLLGSSPTIFCRTAR